MIDPSQQQDVAKVIREAPKDPSSAIPGAPPNYGQFPLPHIMTIQGLATSISRTYRASDEAMRHAMDNARFMRNDTGIMECVEARQRSVALLDWHLEPEDTKSPLQKQLCADLTTIIKRIPRFMQFRENLLHALWFGNYAVQSRYRWQNVNGTMRAYPDHWLPIHGDKLVFSIDRPDQIGVRVGVAASVMGPGKPHDVLDTAKFEGADYPTVPTDRGMAYMLPDWRRRLVCVHKHMIEDGAYEDPLEAGKINGVGIRSKIYWDWFQKQELLAFMMEYLERSAFGLELWYYPWGNAEAEAKTRAAAQERIGNGRNIILVPKPIGDDGHAYGVDHIEPGMQGVESIKDIIDKYYCRRTKRYILGQTLTTESEGGGLGSDGIANVHLATFLDIVKYDATNLEETLTTDLVKIVKLFNMPEAANVHIRFVIDTDSPDVDKKLAATKMAYDMGAEIKESDIMEMVGLAMPTPDDKVLSNRQQMPGDGIPGQNPELAQQMTQQVSAALAGART